MNVQTIQLDVTKAPSTLPVIRLRQGDRNGTTVRAELYDDGEPLQLAGYDVKFCMRVPEDWGYYEVDGYATGNVATFLIDETYAAGNSGKTDTAYVEVLDGEDVIYSTGNVHVVVLPSATEGGQAGTYTNGVERFIEESEQRVDDAIAAIGEISELAVPLMSADVRGGAKLGSGLEIVDGYLNATGGSEYELPTMSASTKGGAKLGSGLAVANDRLSLQGEVFTQAEKSKLAGIDPGANAYELPTATTSTLGGVKPDGTTITADADGTIHGASTYELPPATTSTLGGVKPDGTTVTVDADGTIHSAGGSSKPYQLWRPDGSAVVASATNNDGLTVGTGASANSSSFAAGSNAKATGAWSTALGSNATASGQQSLALGNTTTASAYMSTAIGTLAKATGSWASAFGAGSEAAGRYSHSEGYYTKASGAFQTAIGSCNVEDASPSNNQLGDDAERSTYAFIIGNGKQASRSNALATRWNGLTDIAASKIGTQSTGYPDNTMFPLFIWSTTNPETYTGTYPISPCFVYYTGNNGLYYCTN